MTGAGGRIIRCVLVALAALLFGTVGANAKVGATTLRYLIERSDAIAIVKVKELATIRNLRMARGTVIKPLKGSSAKQTIAFVAQSTWMCDISSAKVGEVALLFLTRVPSDSLLGSKDPKLAGAVASRFGADVPMFAIAHSGRGRMPIWKTAEGLEYVMVLDTNVRVPAGLRTLSGGSWKRPYLGSVALRDVEAYIAKVAAEARNGRRK